MADSSISVPTTTAAELATEVIDDQHHQKVRLTGGEGVANELLIETTGRLTAGLIGTGFFASPNPDPGTSYDAGDLIGTPGYVGRWPASIYELAGANFVDLSGGDPTVFDVLLLGLVSTPDGDPPAVIPDLPADGDPIVPALAPVLTAAQPFYASDAVVNPYLPLVAQIAYDGAGRRLVVTDGVGAVTPTVLVDVYLVFVANQSIAAGATNPGFAGFATMNPTSFLNTSYTP